MVFMTINNFSNSAHINLGNFHSSFDVITALNEIAWSHTILLAMTDIVTAQRFLPEQSLADHYACPQF